MNKTTMFSNYIQKNIENRKNFYNVMEFDTLRFNHTSVEWTWSHCQWKKGERNLSVKFNSAVGTHICPYSTLSADR